MAKDIHTAFFAAGCFWGVEEAFSNLAGVVETHVGYSNGKTYRPTYESVCRGDTGFAETVKIDFDSESIRYEKLLDIFWQIHNPTTLNAQGYDIGTQYRSGIFYLNNSQREQAEICKLKLEKSKKWTNPIVTEILALESFYPAEEYHQKYLKKKNLSYC